jgi:hypothetical protein
MGEDYYNSYIPKDMMSVTNDFYDFIDEYLDQFMVKDPMLLTWAWTKYKEYCESANISYPMPRKNFKEELKNYYKRYDDRTRIDGEYNRNVY